MRVSLIFLTCALGAFAAPAAAQTIGRQQQPTIGGSLDRIVHPRDVMRAANGIGGGFIENLMVEEGLARVDVTYRSQAATPLPPLPDTPTVYAPARRVLPLPDQRDVTGSLTHAPVRVQGLDPAFERQVVAYDGPHRAGTIVIDTNSRYLYLVQTGGQALRYGIGVGRPGFEWAGVKSITARRNGPIGVPRRKCASAAPIFRNSWRADPTTRSARALSILAPRSTASTAPTSLPPSATPFLPVASA